MKRRVFRMHRMVGPLALIVFAQCGRDELALTTAPDPDAEQRSERDVQAISSSTVLVKDGFSRTVLNGWGTAEVGGVWQTSSGDPGVFQVDGSKGLIAKPDNGPYSAVAVEGYGVDVAGLTSFSIDTPPDRPSRYYTVQVYALRNDRNSDGDNYYRYRVRAYGRGKMDVQVEKNVDGKSTWLGNARGITATWAPGQRYWIRWECVGTSPATAIRMRVWADGTAEPTTWDVDVTVNEPALDHPGTTGLRASGPNGSEQVTFPITFTFDDLEYVTRSVAAPSNQAPVADAGGPYGGNTGTPFDFDGTGSSDPDGDPLTYVWDFGDGNTGSGATPSHAYTAAGSYIVTLIVRDSEGAASRPSTTTATVEAPSTSTALVKDSFSRTVSDGWGTAVIGGLWRIDAYFQKDFRVNGSQGQIVAPDNGPRNAVATEGYGVDVAGLVSFSIDTSPDYPNRFYTVQVYARRNDRGSDGDNYYRFRVRSYGNGEMDVRVEKNVAATHTWLVNNTLIAPAWTPGQKYWIRWECVGTSPLTSIKMRAWADGTTEPTSWNLDFMVDEPALDHPGTTGFRVSGPNGSEQTTFPITFSFDDLEYVTK